MKYKASRISRHLVASQIELLKDMDNLVAAVYIGYSKSQGILHLSSDQFICPRAQQSPSLLDKISFENKGCHNILLIPLQIIQMFLLFGKQRQRTDPPQ